MRAQPDILVVDDQPLKGDGRTLPQHFDPEVLRLFKKFHGRFQEIYESRKD
jgi:hypothetical protein